MTKTDFTPGPWIVIGPVGPIGDWAGSSFFVRAPKAPGGVAALIGGLGEVEEQANARLVGSAPALWECVRKAIQLASIASDWNLDEVEIDGTMTSVYTLRSEFESALSQVWKVSDETPDPQ